MKAGVISVKEGKIFVSKDGILTLNLTGKERPIDEIRKAIGSDAEYLAGAGGMDIFIAKNIALQGEWVKPNDKRLDALQDRIIPHLKWIGYL